MAQKAIREYDAKRHLAKYWEKYFPSFQYSFQSLLVSSAAELNKKTEQEPWLSKKNLVVKPDMLFGKRRLNQLVYLQDKKMGDVRLPAASHWIDQQVKRPKTLLCGTQGKLNTFIIEPFLKHDAKEEFYIACTTETNADVLYLSAHGGVDIEQNWDKVIKIKIPLDAQEDEVDQLIESNIPSEMKTQQSITRFAQGFYRFFKDLHFCYLELNPFVLRDHEIYILDVVARVDDTARFIMQEVWDEMTFPAAFGQRETTEIEKGIQDLDEKSGASLKFTLLNLEARVWMLAAGGGASVVYADSVAKLWGVNELANYGEYSGNPTTEETYYYAKGVLNLMTAKKDPAGKSKILIIGGAIANFTDVAKTFDGIIKAFNDMHEKMRDVGVQIYVRRGGPNYEIGLKNIETAALRLNLPIKVYGPETHLTDIVRQAQLMQNEGAHV